MSDSTLKQCVDDVSRWVDGIVIGQSLCPFAAQARPTIRYAATAAVSLEALLECLEGELSRLINVDSAELSTTLIITPMFLQAFDDYLDALALVEQAIEYADLEGTVQVASFHPDYCFDGVDENDPANHTNRSPWPVFHLLREDEVERAIANHPNIDQVPVRNAEHFRQLGKEGIQRLLKAQAKEG